MAAVQGGHCSKLVLWIHELLSNERLSNERLSNEQLSKPSFRPFIETHKSANYYRKLLSNIHFYRNGTKTNYD